MINIFTDGASEGNPGKSGIGIIIYENTNILKEISNSTGHKTNNQAEYLAVIKAIETLEELNIKTANIHIDSQLVVKQLNNEYKVKSEQISILYNKVKQLIKNKEIKFKWIPREENKKADELAKKGIKKTIQKNNENISENLIMEKAFFGKINCLKIQLNNKKETYIHLGLKNKQEWIWKKIKISETEIGELIHILNQKEAKCSFYHKYENKKTQIWCNKNENKFTIKIEDISKNLSIGEYEIFKILLIECIKKTNFKN